MNILFAVLEETLTCLMLFLLRENLQIFCLGRLRLAISVSSAHMQCEQSCSDFIHLEFHEVLEFFHLEFHKVLEIFHLEFHKVLEGSELLRVMNEFKSLPPAFLCWCSYWHIHDDQKAPYLPFKKPHTYQVPCHYHFACVDARGRSAYVNAGQAGQMGHAFT